MITRLLMPIAVLFSICLVGSRIADAAPLTLSIVDEAGRSLPCRVLLRDKDRTCPTPSDSVVLTIGSENWFMSDGSIQYEIPAGRYELRIERGLEFERYKQTIVVPDTRLKMQVLLKRWVNMKQRGYLCAENHLHVDAKSVGAMAIAEGLDFASSLTWWNGPDPKRPVSEGKGKTRSLSFAGRNVTASIYDAELEFGWGAAYIQNLARPFPYPAEKGRPNLFFLRHAVEEGALVHYQGGWSREVGLDALLGLVHTVNICNNNFHMHRFQPRSQYSNLLNVPHFPTYADTEQGMLRMNTDTYYRLLNWGLKLSAGAGSATGVKQVPAGYNRSYVLINPSATLSEFNEAWKQGRNFVSNGPMLFLEGAEGSKPGDAIELGADELGTDPKPFQFKVAALANQPLQSIEIVQNGRVVKNFKITNRFQATHTFSLNLHQGGWIAARCTVRDELLSDQEL
ncbi:hypothetical protein, partial [uncultured Gimesia sp.]|uniref:hypothetical protein n=1 Tax=uncultured Gimesia sp. TaxID=1678688 RepID=UPI00261638AD